MPIVFDEVDASVEPRERGDRGDAGGADGSPEGEPGPQAEAALERWVRRREWLSARRWAD
jgi:hypothetical protein